MNKNSLLTPAEKIEPARNLAANHWGDAFNLIVLAIAVVALAFSPIFTKLSEFELTPTATIFNRFWIATIVVSVWQLIASIRTESVELTDFDSTYKEKGLLILASSSATASALLWAISFTQTSIASSTVLRSLTPLFISLGAWLILKQRFEKQFIVGMILAIIGGTTIGWDDLQLGNEHLLGDGIALLSAALHGVNLLTAGYLRDRGCATDRILLWRCGVGALMVLPVVYLTNVQFFPVSLQGWLVIIALAVVCQTFGQGLLIFSLKQFSSSFVGIFALLKPIVTALLAWIVFAESVSITSSIALILILGGIYLAKSSNSQTQS